MVAILEREPAAVENVPPELQRIVRKALTKDVEMRYQSARDLLIDLKNLRRDLDIKGEIERSVVPTREATTAGITGSETRAFAADATGSGQAQSTKSSSSLEYAVNQVKSHKVATAIVAVLLLAISAIGLTLYVHDRATEVAIVSIAVLPFQNRTADADTEYLRGSALHLCVFA